MTKDKEQEAEPQTPSPRRWQDLGHQYRGIGIAAVAAALEIFSAPEPKPVKRQVSVRYIGNRT